MWNLHIDRALEEFGLHRLSADFCVYACFASEDRFLLGLFVDEMFIVGKLISRIDSVKAFLHTIPLQYLPHVLLGSLVCS